MTYQLIETKTLGTAAASIEFTSIPQDATDLLFLVSGRTTIADNIGYSTFYVNNNTSNWTVRFLQGNTNAVTTGTTTSVPDFFMSGGNTTANTFGMGQIYIPNYTGSTNKSFSIEFFSENNASVAAFAAMQRIVAALWSNTAAITSAQFVANAGSNFAVGTTISLYKITKGSSGGVVVS